MVKVPNDAESGVLSFGRENERDKVFAVFNLSPEPRAVTLGETLYCGSCTDFSSGASVTFDSLARLDLEPWGYRIYVRANADK